MLARYNSFSIPDTHATQELQGRASEMFSINLISPHEIML